MRHEPPNSVKRCVLYSCAKRRSQTDTLTDANRFYNLSHATCYSFGTDNKRIIETYKITLSLSVITWTAFARIFTAVSATITRNKYISKHGRMDIECDTDNQWLVVYITGYLSTSNIPRVCGTGDKHRHEDSLQCRQRRRWNGCHWYAGCLRSTSRQCTDKPLSARDRRVWGNCHSKRRCTKPSLQ